MKFAGRVWRLLVGLKDGLVLVFMLLFFTALFAVLTARPSPAEVRDGALVLALDGLIVEERTEIDPFTALLSQTAPVREFEARELVRALDAAAGDDRIQAVVLDLDSFIGGGQVHLQTVGEALDRVRAADKPVLAFATAFADDGILLASHASEIWLDPLGGAIVTGPGGGQLYFGELLEKLKVNARVYRVGTYKSAVEPYLRDSMSEPARENYAALYGALWEEWQAQVKKARPQADIARVTGDPVAWIEASGGDLAEAALSAGLVDKLGSRQEFEARLVELVGEDEWSSELNAYSQTELGPWLQANEISETGSAIGVITIAGQIVDGDAGPGTAGGKRIADLLDEALEDDLAALVVRVDSPGGSVLASEEIHRAILRHKARDIPIAVSMGNVAASGGYWVATPADRIFAEPETITGSIGIFAVIPTFEGLANEIGVSVDGVRTTPLSGQPDLVGGFTPEVDAILQASVTDGYADFIGRVAAARNLTTDQVDRIGQGRVWDGGTARQIGLVDQYGGLDTAISWAAAQAGLEDGDWHAAYLGSTPSTYDTLLRQWLVGDGESSRADVATLFSRQQEALGGQLVGDLERLLTTRGAQAYCLECPPAPQSDTVGGRKLSGWLAKLVALFAS
ncbi:signal peptide peptidase SppA [Erythrobacter sp. QSSC1-22B]|uniref:signal peptide peptidase SppA n=1 Tax=Erythrobacter sp. QSSC1-22B TaxID=1860125 RepID=UPI0008059509|nr:signal peptide peptidase SppA [Erythrobacter sp. QSSC1-22B]OBX18906.1 signal peptide peptidase SppA [Erythrobacter sp. QSSC1-22B]